MVIDTSAILAVLLNEAEAEFFAQAIASDPRRLVSAVSILEAGIVVRTRKGPSGGQALDQLIESAGLTIADFDAEQARLARVAYEQFGKRQHPAALNLGDCCSYALARHTGEPLLFKGEDFPKTDIPQWKPKPPDTGEGATG